MVLGKTRRCLSETHSLPCEDAKRDWHWRLGVLSCFLADLDISIFITYKILSAKVDFTSKSLKSVKETLNDPIWIEFLFWPHFLSNKISYDCWEVLYRYIYLKWHPSSFVCRLFFHQHCHHCFLLSERMGFFACVPLWCGDSLGAETQLLGRCPGFKSSSRQEHNLLKCPWVIH